MAHRGGRVIDTNTLRIFLVLHVPSDGQEREQGSEDNPDVHAHQRSPAAALPLASDPAWLTVMCDAGNRIARWAGGLKRVSKAVAVARRASYVAAKRERCSSMTNPAQECLLRSWHSTRTASAQRRS